MIKRNLEFKVVIGDKTMNYDIEIPRNEGLMDIEIAKSTLAKGKYGEINSNRTIQSNQALDRIDMEAHLTICCPKLIEDLKAPIGKLDPFDLVPLQKAYEEQFLPWWSEWNIALNKIKVVKEEKDQEDRVDEQSE